MAWVVLHVDPLQMVTLKEGFLTQFYTANDRGSEKLGNLFKVMQLLSGCGKIWV